jgi:hypothetical protein
LLHGHTQTNRNGGVSINYTCSTARKYGKDQCPRYSIPARELEGFVLDQVRVYFIEVCPKEALKEGLERIFSEREKSFEEVEAKRRELNAFNKRKDAAFQQIVGGKRIEFFQKNLDAMEEEGKILETSLSAAVALAQKQFDKNVLIDQCLDLYENHILQLEGGCEKALREALRALGVEVIVNPDKKEGGIEVNPFVHSFAS